MSTALREAKVKSAAAIADRALSVGGDLAGRSLDTVKEVSIQALRNPLVTMVIANVIIELLQRVELNTVPEQWSWVTQPGTHALVYRRVKSPLISQVHATTMESIINTASVIESLGGLADIGALIGKFLK
jgi:hypothetical protein